MITIKQYPSGRLYDTAESRYVNLHEVAAMVRKGTDIEVIDDATGEDLTRLILKQIIIEEGDSLTSLDEIEASWQYLH